MYTDIDFKTKKALNDAFKNREKITVYQPGGIFPGKKNGKVFLEGPHYPAAHTWYATVEVEDGIIVRIYG